MTAIADARMAAGLAGLDGIEFDDARRGVAAEQGALRPAQHFEAVGVEDRETLEDRVFEHDIDIDEAERLRRGEVEVGVAEPAGKEAREGGTQRAYEGEDGEGED